MCRFSATLPAGPFNLASGMLLIISYNCSFSWEIVKAQINTNVIAPD